VSSSGAELGGDHLAQPGLVFRPMPVGPGGPSPMKQPPASVARVLPIVPPAYSIGTMSFVSGNWTLVSVDRPVVLVPFFGGTPGVGPLYTLLEARYSPEKPINNVGYSAGQPDGLLARRGRVWLPQPGDWWVQINTGAVDATVPYVVADATEPGFADRVLNPGTAGFVYSSTVTLAPATPFILYRERVFLHGTWLRVENAGGNGIRLTFGDEVPSAVVGFNLPTQAANPQHCYMDFDLERLPCAALRAFSSLGSDIRWTLGSEVAEP
jgi:hypothetical protein